jgi:hypothetical protein
MIEKGQKYDPAIYGNLRASFLEKIDPSPLFTTNSIKDDERIKQEMIKEIREKKILIIQP